MAIASHRRGAVRHAADIESEAELARIEALGCDAGHGDLLGRPTAPETLEDQLKPLVVA